MALVQSPVRPLGPSTGRPQPTSDLLDKEHAVGDMCEAAWQGGLAELQRLLRLGASPSEADYDGRTPLHLAACKGALDCVKLLVESGATLQQDRFGCLPIHDAVRYGHTDIVEYLRALDVPVWQGFQNDPLKSRVFATVVRKGTFAMDMVQLELQHFFDLGLDPSYFAEYSTEEVSNHINALIAARCMARTTNSAVVKSEQHSGTSSTCMVTLEHSRSVEARLSESLDENLSTDGSGLTRSAYLKAFYTARPAIRSGKSPLALFTLQYENLPAGKPGIVNEDRLDAVASQRFLGSVSPARRRLFQDLMAKLLDSKSAIVQVRPDGEWDAGMVKIIFATYEISGRTYLRELCQVFRSYNCHPRIVTVESFANGAVIYEFDFLVAQWEAQPVGVNTMFSGKLSDVVETFSSVPFIASIPKEGQVIVDMAMSAKITFGHAIYLLSATKFCFHFYPKETHEYLELRDKLRHSPQSQASLDTLYLKTIGEIIVEEKIFEVYAKYHTLTRKMYDQFKRISFGIEKPKFNQTLHDEIERTIGDESSRQILTQALLFNAHLRVTNTYKGKDLKSQKDSDSQSVAASGVNLKRGGTGVPGGTEICTEDGDGGVRMLTLPAALAYRIDPSFLATRNRSLYPEIPYGVFLIVGRGFYGFHVRFRDVARGGIRIIRSRNNEVYKVNAARLFEENYNLAFTQQKKNKDIPEGGSKGTILLAPEDRNQTATGMRSSFLGYIDGLLDVMMEDAGLYSWLDGPEMLFFGPDENTANLMDLGAKRAYRRGYRFWKSLTTGKSTELGGIPHDVYGMTTNSVHMYSLGLYEKLGLDEREVTKIQTGGPDGDLGSNEILISHDRTLGVVDGSGTAYDPQGLDRPELIRLAKERLPIAHFDRSKIGPGGFLVLIDDMHIQMPDGSIEQSGVKLRDTFHTSKWASADLFVPCGGRPNAVHGGNVQQLFTEGGQPKFKYIVEGANLFFTNDARVVLEEAGVKIFKDASTNKGGVTSSSMEVFAALCMNPDMHADCMTVSIGKEPPAFYRRYAAAILDIVKENARSEFEILWGQMTQGVSSMEATDRLSAKINEITDAIFNELMARENNALMEQALRRSIPPCLVEQVGFENILTNTPYNYLVSICAMYLASRYVYQVGLNASDFSFYQFMSTVFTPPQQ